mgnify:FL=1|tara:strand:+ start:4527 stop:5345 length:819 start_codon:yes stop_codon:yes gene_type:complete
MSGLEYYEITGFLQTYDADYNRGGNDYTSEWDFPSTPMYLDGSSYNGRCMVWLKSVRIGENFVYDALAVRALLNTVNLNLVLNVPSLNQLGIKPQTPTGGADIQTEILGAGGYKISSSVGGGGGASIFTPMTFPFHPNTQHLVEVGSKGVAGTVEQTTSLLDIDELQHKHSVVAVGTGDGTGANAPAVSYDSQFAMVDNAKNFSMYVNPNVGKESCGVVCNNLWGSRITATILDTQLEKGNAGKYKNSVVTNVKASMEVRLVIKPLKNEVKL